jgi:ankyrin repeat protein
MSTAADLIAAVIAGEAERVAEIVADDPALASSRDADGVSAIMLSRYRSNRAVTDALIAADPELDVFEAAALGYLDRLRERLEDDPEAVRTMSADGYTALHFAAFFAKPEAARILLEAGASVGTVAQNEMRVQPLHSAAAGRQIEICRLRWRPGRRWTPPAGGFTPLHEAVQNATGDGRTVPTASADPTALTDDGRSAADIADDPPTRTLPGASARWLRRFQARLRRDVAT